MSEKIPVELASMVGDYEGIDDIRSFEDNPMAKDEYWVIGTRIWSKPISYIKEHNYEIVGVDRYRESKNQIRIWIRNND